MAEQFLSPELRLVQGDCFVGNDKNQQGIPYKTQAGEPQSKWFIGGAGRKGDPLVEAFKLKIENAARVGFPHLFPGGGACTHPKFSYKIIDGDGIDDNGVSNATKAGFAGHWVFKFASNFAPRCFPLGKWTPADQLFPPAQGLNPIPRGHYIKVAGTIEPNGQTAKPGVYVNLNLVEYQRPGDAIVSGPDVASIFGGGGVISAPAPAAAVTYQAAPSYVAQGHTVESLRAAGGGQTDAQLAAAGWLVAVAATVAQPRPVMAPLPPPPQAPAAAVTYQAAPSYVAQGHTVESLRAAGGGQTDAQLAAAGWLVAVAATVAQPVVVAPNPAALGIAPPPLAPAGSAPPPPAPAPIAVAGGCPPGFKMVNPAGTSYAAYIAAQWTDAMLVQNGHMVPA